MIPTDPIMQMSYINTKLRDECHSLDDFCDKYDVSKEDIIKTMASIGYTYNSELNKFV